MPAHAWFEIWCTLKRLERWDRKFSGRPVKGATQYPIEFIFIDGHFLKKYGNVDLKYIKAGDHIFLVIAKINGYPIITTDKKMREVAESEGIPVYNPLEFMNSNN
jgi:rRNA-processing protein FCF1